jgi:hypothetical protein
VHKVNAVTPEQVSAGAGKYLPPGQMKAVVVGTKTKIPEPIKCSGKRETKLGFSFGCMTKASSRRSRSHKFSRTKSGAEDQIEPRSSGSGNLSWQRLRIGSVGRGEKGKTKTGSQGWHGTPCYNFLIPMPLKANGGLYR